MEKVGSYKDFADDDYDFYIEALEKGHVPNSIGATSQNICERYLKHILDKYFIPKSDEEINAKNECLRTHNLKKLLNQTAEFTDIDDETAAKIKAADGYYFSTRYPGEDAMIMTQRDIDACIAAIKAAKSFVERYEAEMEKKLAESKSGEDNKS